MLGSAKLKLEEEKKKALDYADTHRAREKKTGGRDIKWMQVDH